MCWPRYGLPWATGCGRSDRPSTIGLRPSKSILLATTNPAKAARLRWLLEGLPLEPLTAEIQAPVESGASYLENACLKALAASGDGLAIASDGGIEIPVLGSSWNGLYTARAAGPGADDQARAEHLLEVMRGQTNRRVCWTEAVAVAERGKHIESWEASGNEGVLAETYDPTNAIPGFWVYSLWHYPKLGRRYVDLSQEELDRADLTWSRLKEQVQAYFRDADEQRGRYS